MTDEKPHSRYRPGKKKTSEPTKCIFCGKSGLTKEHIFSDWLKDILPRREKDKHIDVLNEGALVSTPTSLDQILNNEKDIKYQNGAANSKTVKVVCGSRGRTDAKYCNDGWMSRLDEKAKPILRSLVNGEKVEITTDSQAALAAWAAKSTITAEFLRPNEVAISESDRHHLMTNLEPSSQWKILIAPYHGALWYTGYHHFPIRLGPAGDVQTGPKNTQNTLFGLGRLLIYVVTFPHNFSFQPEGPGFQSFRQIWPLTGRVISWPTERFVDDVAAWKVAGSLSKALHQKQMMTSDSTAYFFTNAQQAPRKTTTLAVGIPDDSSTVIHSAIRPFIFGDGNEDLICGGCGCVFSQGATGPDIYNRLSADNDLFVQCPCGTYNKILVQN